MSTLALGSNTLNLPLSDGSQGNPVFRPQFTVTPSLPINVMTWASPPTNTPAWTFDLSLQGPGSDGVWGVDGTGNWDTGANWGYAVLTGGSLSYTPGGLELTALNFSSVPGTASPGAGAAVAITPIPTATQNAVVNGPAGSVSVGALQIYGTNGYTASLVLNGTGTLSASSVSVLAGGNLADDGALVTPSLAISGGNVSLTDALSSVGTAAITSGGGLSVGGGNVGVATVDNSSILSVSGGSVGAATSSGTLSVSGGNVSTATILSGVASLGGGNVGTVNASGGNTTIGGAAVTSALVSGNAVVNATSGSVTALSANGGITTVSAPATFGAATVSGTATVSLSNTNLMSNLTVSGGTASTNGNTITTAVVSGGVFNPQSTTITNFTHSSGVTTFGPSVTIGTADVSAGAGTVNATNPITISSALKLPNTVTATLTGASSFVVGGANLASATTTNNLTLSGGTLSLTTPPTGIINVATGGEVYSGVGPASDTGTVWNTYAYSASGTTIAHMLNSAGATTNVGYSTSVQAAFIVLVAIRCPCSSLIRSSMAAHLHRYSHSAA